MAPNDVAGLFASVIVQKMPRLIPSVIVETDKTIVFKHPRPKHRIHYMFVPKKDIKNIGELTDEDNEYIIDLFSTIVALVNKLGIKNYRLWTNGPEKQDVTYLHFHLGAE
ncbi:MAG: HIT domain-containing protein [Deltaproteobacteria bacterium]|nr:HIT domain-containing protein [Candidatus Tharpella sp.]